MPRCKAYELLTINDYQLQDLADELGWDIEKLFDTRMQEEPHLLLNSDEEEFGDGRCVLPRWGCVNHVHHHDDAAANDEDAADDCGNGNQPTRSLKRMAQIVKCAALESHNSFDYVTVNVQAVPTPVGGVEKKIRKRRSSETAFDWLYG